MFNQNNVNKLPPLAQTGIGSLPPMDWSSAQEAIFSLDIPYLATFPKLNSRDGFLEELETGEFPIFLQEFLEELPFRNPKWIKIQWPGPYSLKELAKRNQGQASRHYEERLKGFLDNFKSYIPNLLFFLDEPGLNAGEDFNSYSPGDWEKLKKSLGFLRDQGVVPGLHCCGNAPWGKILDLPLSILSFDVALSLNMLLQHSPKLREFHRRGGRLAFGLVPTRLPENWEPQKVGEDLLKSLTQALGPKLGLEFVAKGLLTPSCGLGLRSVGESEQVFKSLKEVGKILKENIKP